MGRRVRLLRRSFLGRRLVGAVILAILLAISMLSQSCEPADMPAPSPPATPSTSDLADHPLSELSPNAQRYLDGRQGRWGIAVVIPSQEAIYVSNADQPMSMASVVKVVIMLAVMDRAIKEEQPLTSWEQQQLRLMITESDNDAATALWEALGGADAVEAYLQSIDMTGIYPNPQEAWGASRATPRAVALLFAKLALGEILDQPSRKLAMELLAEVVPSQRWGVSAGLPNDLPPGTIVGIKDGWYPAESGWWVNSAGSNPTGGQPSQLHHRSSHTRPAHHGIRHRHDRRSRGAGPPCTAWDSPLRHLPRRPLSTGEGVSPPLAVKPDRPELDHCQPVRSWYH